MIEKWLLINNLAVLYSFTADIKQTVIAILKCFEKWHVIYEILIYLIISSSI